MPLPVRVARHFNLRQDSAAFVAGVSPGSPAVRAGLKEGDVIISFAGRPVANLDDVHRLLTADVIGRVIEVVLLRRWTLKRTVTIVPAPAPD